MTRFIFPILTFLVLALAGAVPALADEGGTGFERTDMHSGLDLGKPGIIALCYHNIEDHDPDQTYVGVTSAKLIEQLSWLKANGYHPISADDVIAARAGIRPLPDKPIILTFDDGFESFYTRVYPILKAYHFPAIEALVGSWMAPADPDGKVAYGDGRLDRAMFLTWDQVREMQASGLVEFAAHSNEQHHGIRANPQGNSEAAVVTRLYNPETGYETEAAYQERLNDDLGTISATIAKELGKAPRLMVWPYGEYNGMSLSISVEHGMPITFSLDGGLMKVDQLIASSRNLITADPGMDEYTGDIYRMSDVEPVRVVQVDLDYVYDPDPAQQERNLGALISRIYDENINAVFLQAFADPSGDGLARSVYFPNRHLPMRADLFNRVAWQLHTRAHVRVFAWMPVMAFDFGPDAPQVLAWDPVTKTAAPDPNSYHRLSIFDPAARQAIIDLYEDLAKAAPIDGILFHDDAALSDYEDASAPALAAYARAGLPASIEEIRASPDLMRRWTEFKTQALSEFTDELLQHAKYYRQPLLTARNIYASPILKPESQQWFAQTLDDYLAHYDYVAVEAMPFMENVDADDADEWLKHLVEAVSGHPQGLKRTIFELQSVDWRKTQDGADKYIPTAVLAEQMRLLARMGALNFGYYPDDFIGNHPDAKALHEDFSLQYYRYLP